MKVRKKALVADDYEENRKLIKAFLYFRGYDAELTEDGLAARARLEKEAYSLVVSDIEMPNMNGFELLAWIRSQETIKKLPVIMLSTLDSSAVIDRCKRLGATAYIVKPFTKEKMDQALEAVESGS